MATTHIFVSQAFKTLSPICSEALVFSKELGRRLTLETDDKSETVFLFQLLSVAICKNTTLYALLTPSIPLNVTLVNVLSIY